MTARIAAALAASLLFAFATAAWVEAAERPTSRGGLSATLSEIGSVGMESCRRSLSELPLDQMAPEHRRLVEHFGQSTTLHRRLPAATVDCERSLLEFVLTKPEILVDVWRVLDISRVTLDPVAEGTWRLSDGYGTTGSVQLIHQERGPTGSLLVFHGLGGYSGPLSPKQLTGSCLIVVRHTVLADMDHPAQQVAIEAFLDVDGLGLEIVTRTLQPLNVRSAAANVHEICLFLSQFAKAASRNPAGLARLAERMPRTAPRDRRMLVSLACGQTGTPPIRPLVDASADAVHEELAARWLPADSLDAMHTR